MTALFDRLAAVAGAVRGTPEAAGAMAAAEAESRATDAAFGAQVGSGHGVGLRGGRGRGAYHMFHSARAGGAQVALVDDLVSRAAKSSDVIDAEMAAAAATVADATAHLESMLQKAKAEMSEKQLAVNGAILGTSLTLMQHIKSTCVCACVRL